jgi:two-component system C4-dicarboxylate transport sensor histidine kinase DctB
MYGVNGAFIPPILSNALDLVGEQLRLDGVGIVSEFAEGCQSVMCDTIQMEQVALNLLSNARDSMARSDYESKITLRVFADTHGVYITLQDTGGGIAEDALQRIFEPFYTTRELGKGTSLGLSIPYGIMRDMDDTITVETIYDGARFKIALRRPISAVKLI